MVTQGISAETILGYEFTELDAITVVARGKCETFTTLFWATLQSAGCKF